MNKQVFVVIELGIDWEDTEIKSIKVHTTLESAMKVLKAKVDKTQLGGIEKENKNPIRSLWYKEPNQNFLNLKLEIHNAKLIGEIK